MTVLSMITGLLLLLAGRRLFWVSVACVGFIVAYHLTLATGMGGPAWIAWALPLGIGLVGALVALVYQKIAVVLAGFMIGGLIVTDLFHLLGIYDGIFSLIILVAGGIAGAIAMLVIFDWALIVLSSLAGAFVIVQSMGLDNTMGNSAILVLALLGTMVQTLFFLKSGNRSNSG